MSGSWAKLPGRKLVSSSGAWSTQGRAPRPGAPTPATEVVTQGARRMACQLQVCAVMQNQRHADITQHRALGECGAKVGAGECTRRLARVWDKSVGW
eukprot:1159519-Pelagomonas_calceolata.AAC.6